MSVRKLEDCDKEMVMSFIDQEPAQNIEMIGGLNLFGISNGISVFYGIFVQEDLKGIIAHVEPATVQYYTTGAGESEEAAQFINELNWKELYGKKEAIEPLIHKIDHKEMVNRFLAETDDYDWFELDASMVATVTSELELQEVIDLYEEIEEFQDFMSMGREKVLEIYRKIALEGENGKKTYLRKNGRLVATAGAGMENSDYALLEGVATAVDYRNQGLASIACMQLMNEYKKKGKRLCLFYTNPAAGSIYRRLGFKETSVGLELHRS